MSNHVYEFGTIAELRKIYETHAREADLAADRVQHLLANAASHAALARDAALLLDVIDPAWTAECEAPIVARQLRLRAWRDMLNFLEAHPEIGIGDYESVTIEQPNGERATVEFIESLEQLGIKVGRSEKYLTAELWFGNHDVRFSAYAKLEPPAEPEPVTDAIEEHQSADGQIDPAVAEQIHRGIVEAEAGKTAYLGSFAEHAAEDQALEDADFAIGDRVVLLTGNENFVGRLGTVKSIVPHDLHKWAIGVLLDGDTKVRPYGPLELAYVPDDAPAATTGDAMAGQPA